MRLKNLKKAVLLLLTSAMLVSTPLTAFATGVGGQSSAAGTTSGGVVTAAGGDFSANISSGHTSGKIGIRMSLVDAKNPQNVISLDDTGNPRVVDILYVTEDQFLRQTEGTDIAGNVYPPYHSLLEDKYEFNSVKTQSLTSVATNPQQTVERVYYDKLNTWLQSQGVTSNMPAWLYHDGDYTSNGDEFVNWCKPIGTGSQLFTVTVSGYAIPVTVAVEADGDSVYTEVQDHTGSSYDYIDGTPLDFYNKKVDELSVEQLKKQWDFYSSRHDYNKTCELFTRYVIDTMTSAKGTAASIEGDTTTFNYAEREKAIDDALELAYESVSQIVDDVEQAPNLRVMVNNTLAEAFGAAPVTSENGNTVLPQGQNPSSQPNSSARTTNDKTTPSGDGTDTSAENLLPKANIEHILAMTSDSGNPLFQTESMIAARAKGEELSIKDATEDWVLLVEPIIWLTIFPNGTDTKAIHTKIYGTITNIVDAFNDPNLDANPERLYDYRNKKTFNWKAINAAVWWALDVDSEGFTFDPENSNSLAYLPIESSPELVQAINNKYISFEKLKNVSEAGVQGAVKSYDLKTGDKITGLARTCEIGYGVNIYSKFSVMEPVPDLTSDPWDPSDYTKPIKLVKWYVVENTTAYGKVTRNVVDVKTGRVGRYLAVVNEPAGQTGLYEVERWITGKDDTALPNDGDLSSKFDDYANRAPGSFSGTDPAIVNLRDKEDEKIIYVELVYKPVVPNTTPDDITIIKVFEPSDGTPPTVEEETIPKGTPEYNANEPDWTYEEDIQTPAPKVPVSEWPDVPTSGDPGDNPRIPVNPDTSTIYIRYSEAPDFEENKLVLYENELSYHFESLSELSGTTLVPLVIDGEQVLDALGEPMYVPAALLATLTETFADMSGDVDLCDTEHYRDGCSCGGWDDYCDCDDPECGGCESDPICDGHTGTATSRIIDDDEYTLKTESREPDRNFIIDFHEKGNSWSTNGTMTISGGTTDNLTPDATYTLYRNKTKDVVTLYPGKNDRIKSQLRELGITEEGYEPRNTRVATENSGSWYSDFKTHFEDATDDRELSWKWICPEKSSHEESGTWESVADNPYSSLNDPYSIDDNVITYYELGKTNTATAVPEASTNGKLFVTFKNNKSAHVGTDGKIEFYPYIRMEADGKTVAVTSTNKSSMPANVKIEAGVWKNGAADKDVLNGRAAKPNVELTSTQWSVHMNSLQFLKKNDVDDKNTVLPGGAIFDVSMSKPDRGAWPSATADVPTTSTKLGYRLWQTVIDDGLAANLASTSTAPTMTEAKNFITEFDQSIRNRINRYGLQQVVQNGIILYDEYLRSFVTENDPKYVYNGGTYNGIKLNKDNKYYLKMVTPGTGSSQLDTSVANFGIRDGGQVMQCVYTVKSDVHGKVSVYRDGTLLGSINKHQTVESLLSNSEIKELDNNTKLVTNYINAIDRNVGEHVRTGDKGWYNEAFDGVSVLMTDLTYDIDFGDGKTGDLGYEAKNTKVRSAVQDVFLVGKATSKSDLYNFSADRVKSSICLTAEIKDGQIVKPSGELGQLKLKNGTPITVKINDMNIFAYTKMFYIPNVTVSDLN